MPNFDQNLVKSVQSALSDLLTTSATHGTFSRPSTKRGLILIGLELNTNARESFEHCSSYSLNLSIDQHVCHFPSWHLHSEFFLSRPFPGSLSVIWNNEIAAIYHCQFLLGKFGRSLVLESVPLRCCKVMKGR